MLFSRKAADPARVLRLIRSADWRQGETLRITPRPKWPSVAANASPAARRLVIRRQASGELAFAPMRWGLVTAPSSGNLPGRPLNTVRAEAFAAEPEWQWLLAGQRCLVPADQFFEWKRVDGAMTREFAFRLRSGRPMMIAAIWNRTPDGGDTFAWISCSANRLVGQVHDRMPVILDEAGIADWFDPESSLNTLLARMTQVADTSLEMAPVQQRLVAPVPAARHAAAQGRPHAGTLQGLFERRAA